jgi:hypothetical protein
MATESAELIAKLSLDNARFKKQLKEARDKLKEFGDQGEQSGDQAKEGFDNAGKGASQFSKDLDSMKGLVASVFTAGALLDFERAVINATSEFQRMESVLSNTLGSNSSAQIAMRQIVDFAQKTPFQVNELTDAFIKLANRGFVPTIEQMTAMGDLASSTGKSFDQLVEAILDAQTGELERLKEFGVTSKQEGDRIQFTFKGVTTEVQKSDKAIQDYLISLGKMEGVAGAMEGISRTTGGIISNLGDNIAGLFTDIGNSSSGFINWFIKDLNRVVTSIRYMSETLEGLNPFKNISEKSEDFRKFLLTVSEATTDTGLAYKDFASTFNKVDLKKLLGDTRYRQLFIDTLKKEGNSLKESQSLWETYVKIRKQSFDDEQKLNASKIQSIKVTSGLTEEEKRRAEEARKAHKEKIKELRAEESAFLKLAKAMPLQRGFIDTDKLKAVKKLTDDIIGKALKPVITQGIIIPQEAIDRIKLAKEEQAQFNKEMSIASTISSMLGDTFQSAFEGMLNTGKISFKGIIDGLKALIIKLISAAAAAAVLAGILAATGLGAAGGFIGNFKDIFGKMTGLAGLFGKTTPFAEGGMVTGLTTAILGDNPSGKEAVIPFEKMGSFLSQYGNGGGNMRVEVVGTIKGQDIYLSGSNYSQRRNKILGV